MESYLNYDRRMRAESKERTRTYRLLFQLSHPHNRSIHQNHWNQQVQDRTNHQAHYRAISQPTIVMEWMLAWCQSGWERELKRGGAVKVTWLAPAAKLSAVVITVTPSAHASNSSAHRNDPVEI
eukprot:scaffold912_cov187-Ochromonas_danica.AAC.9